MPNDLSVTRTPRRDGGWSWLVWVAGGVVMIAGAVALWSDGGLSAPPPATPLAEEVQALSVVASAQAAPFVSLAPRSERFTIELGMLFTDADAERVERQLNEAGYQTVRFRQDQRGAPVYTVVIERARDRHEANAILSALREAGLLGTVHHGVGGFSVHADAALARRSAELVVRRLRASGYTARVVAEPDTAATFVLRHGTFSTRQEAEQTGRALERLGLPNQVVQLR
jgi:sporulation related protein